MFTNSEGYRTASSVNGLRSSYLGHFMLFSSPTSSYIHSLPSLQPKTAALTTANGLHKSCLQPCWHLGGSQEDTLEVCSQNCFLAEQASLVSRAALSSRLGEYEYIQKWLSPKYTVRNSQAWAESMNLIGEKIHKTKSFWIHDTALQ